MSGSAVKIPSTIVSVGGHFGKDQMSDTIQSQKLQNVWFATPMYLKSQLKEGRKEASKDLQPWHWIICCSEKDCNQYRSNSEND